MRSGPETGHRIQARHAGQVGLLVLLLCVLALLAGSVLLRDCYVDHRARRR